MPTKSYIIRIGGNNKIEREETFKRIEDAICSLGSAIEDGIVTGAGYTYVEALCSLMEINKQPGIIDMLNTAMTYVNSIIQIEDYSHIYDSATVVKEVIKNSFTLVAQIITTKKIIYDKL